MNLKVQRATEQRVKFDKDCIDIPSEVLQARDDGKLAFFCGAGISIDTGLPGFGGFENLFTKVCQRENIYLTKYGYLEECVASKKCMYEEGGSDLKECECAKEMDRKFADLEEHIGQEHMRKLVIRLLKKGVRPDLLKTHKAILQLAQHNNQMHLVTTNFDNRFDKAAPKKHWDIDIMPNFPDLFDPEGWNSLVYLHGKIRQGKDPKGEGLILTDYDYGRIYLAGGAASRFITKLVKEFNVLLIGYSAEDTMLRYLFNALKSKPGSKRIYKKIWTFAPHADGEEQKISSQWKRKNVEPILYNQQNKHALLHETLDQWSQYVRDPLAFRTDKLDKDLQNEPTDETADRVLWAIEEPKTHKHVEQIIYDLERANIFIQWLDRLRPEYPQNDLQQLLSKLRLGTPHKTLRDLLDILRPKLPKQGRDIWTLKLPKDTLQYWISNNLHLPKLLMWLIGNDDLLDRALKLRIEDEITPKKRQNIDKELLADWRRLILTSPVNLDPISIISSIDLLKKRSIDVNEQQAVFMRLLDDLQPVVTSSDIPRLSSSRPRFEVACKTKIESNMYSFLKLLRDLKEIEESLKNLFRPYTYPGNFEAINGLLLRALQLSEDIGVASSENRYDDSYYTLLSIADHYQNYSYYDRNYAYLICLTRDAASYVLKKDEQRAYAILDSWLLLPYPVFQRLYLHACTEHKNIEQNKLDNIADWLLTQDNLWQSGIKRELCCFFRKVAHRLPPTKLNDIYSRILQGPSQQLMNKWEDMALQNQGMFGQDTNDDTIKRMLDREIKHDIWLRLAKVKENNRIKLPQKWAEKIKELKQEAKNKNWREFHLDKKTRKEEFSGGWTTSRSWVLGKHSDFRKPVEKHLKDLLRAPEEDRPNLLRNSLEDFAMLDIEMMPKKQRKQQEGMQQLISLFWDQQFYELDATLKDLLNYEDETADEHYLWLAVAHKCNDTLRNLRENIEHQKNNPKNADSGIADEHLRKIVHLSLTMLEKLSDSVLMELVELPACILLEIVVFLDQDIPDRTNIQRTYLSVWKKIWRITESKQASARGEYGVSYRDHGSGEKEIDFYGTAINHPAGILAQCLITALDNERLKAGSGIPAELLPYFNRVTEENNKQFSIWSYVIFASQLMFLNAIDKAWCKQNIFPHFNSDEENMAAMWSGYIMSNAVGPELKDVLFDALIQFLESEDEKFKYIRKELMPFVSCLCERYNLKGKKREKMHQTIDKLPEELLANLLPYFYEHREISFDDGKAHWKEVKRFIYNYWPRDINKLSPESKQRFYKILSLTGDAFPKAFDYLREREFIRPFSSASEANASISASDVVPGPVGPFLVHPNPSNLARICKKYPQESLVMLSFAYQKDLEPDNSWVFSDLRKLLKIIEETNKLSASEKKEFGGIKTKILS